MAQKIEVPIFLKPKNTPGYPVALDVAKYRAPLVRLRVGPYEGPTNLAELTPSEARRVAYALLDAAERAAAS